jgi:PAT family beta-lactamase induction signal transducer AmpG
MKINNKNLLAILFLGFSSGFPLSLLTGTLTARYTEAGLSIMAIGALSLIQLPYLLKPLWAPLMDRFKLLPMSRRRSWLLLTQLLIAISLFIMSAIKAVSHPALLAYVALCLAFFSASFDISYDAYRTDLLPEHERGAGASMVSLGYRLALLVSGAFSLVIASYIGFRGTYFIMAVIMLSLTLVTVFSADPKNDKHDVTTGLKNIWRDPLADLFNRRNLILFLVFIVLYKLCDAFALSLSTTFLLRHLHFSLATIGAAMKTVSLIATLLGALLGGYLMRHLSLWQSLFYFGILQALSNSGYLLLAIIGKHFYVMIGAVFIEYFAGGLVTVAFVAYLTSMCNTKFSATQYALLSALASSGRVLVGPIAAISEIRYGWTGYFVISILLGLPPLFLLLIWRQRFSLVQPSFEIAS